MPDILKQRIVLTKASPGETPQRETLAKRLPPLVGQGPYTGTPLCPGRCKVAITG